MNNKQTESKILSPQFLRKRKMLLVLPILVLPFVTMAFWALGGGSAGSSPKPPSSSGLNLQLPEAHLKDDKSENKLSFYEEADQDSMKMGREINNDPFLKLNGVKDTSFFHLKPETSNLTYDPLPEENYKDPNEVKVYQKLAKLNEQLKTGNVKNNSGEIASNVDNTTSVNKEDVNRLGQIIQQMNKKDSVADDPELNNLNSMMEKILDIQHPERVKERLQEKSMENNRNVFPVSKEPVLTSVSLLDTTERKQNDTNEFFGLEDESNSAEQNAIEAVVHENQTLVSGSIIKLRLLSDISVDGNIIPKDNFVFGMVSLNGERLQVEVSSVRVDHSLFPVKLQVYDMDGLPGIYIPGAVTRDVAKESLNNATQMMEVSSLDPSVKAQATTAGIDAVKTLLSKKTKLVKVTVKAGYKVLLK
jgi:conjugative transposon TraM protein